MLPRTFFLKINNHGFTNIDKLMLLEETLSHSLCYIIRDYLESVGYSGLHVSHNYNRYNVDNAYKITEELVDYIVLDNMYIYTDILRKNIGDIIEYYRFNYDINKTILNFNSCLINADTFITTAFVLEKSQ